MRKDESRNFWAHMLNSGQSFADIWLFFLLKFKLSNSKDNIEIRF